MLHAFLLHMLLASSAPLPQDAAGDGAPPAAEKRPEGIAAHSFRWAQAADGSWILVARVDPAPGWHVYWMNPGDSGNPPSFELSLPAGWRAGRTVFPRPEAKSMDGGVFYGYSRAVHYLVPVKRTDALSRDTWPGGDGGGAGDTWKVRAKVMACKERCTMATLAASGNWPPTAEAGTGLVLDGGSIGGRSLPATAASAGVFARLDAGKVRIEGPSQGHGTVRFIPAAVPGMQVDLPGGAVGLDATVQGDRFTLKFALQGAGQGPGEPAVAGLLLFGNSPSDPCVWLSIPHPLAGPDGQSGGAGASDGSGATK